MPNRLVVVGFLVATLSSPAVGGELKSVVVPATPLLPATITGAVNQQADAITTKPGYAEWANRLERARGKSRHGRNWVIAGLGLSVGCAALMTVKVREAKGIDDTGIGAINSACLAGTLAGAGITVFGAFRLMTAHGEIDALNREGHTKGYVLLSPLSDGGVLMAARFVF